MKTEKILLGGRKFVFSEEILFLQSSYNYTFIYFTNGKKILSGTTLKILENRLKNHGFIRVNRSSLVNIDFVRAYENCGKNAQIVLQNDEVIGVSRRRTKLIENTLFC